METLGKNLKELRRINKLSQAQFARKMNMAQQNVSEWECDKVEPSLYSIIKILKLYDITFEELIDGVKFD